MDKRLLKIVGCAAAVTIAIFAIVVAGRMFSRPSPSATETMSDLTQEYAGIKTCATCHGDKAAAHARSGHSHTFSASSDAAISPRLNGRRFYDAERDYEHQFHFSRPDGLSVTIPRQFGERSFPLQYVFGSGTHAVSFLTLIPGRDRQTHGVEYRVTAFGSDERLGLTPGHRDLAPHFDIEHFGKVIPQGELLSRCIECHTTTHTIGEKELTDFVPNVTCESCHGPGARHVMAMRNGESELHIRSRWSAQAQLEMCGVCHRRTDWLEKPVKTDKKIVRFQPVGLSQSKCYVKSAGRLSCTTCHDPHEPPSADRPGYDARCMNCHSGTDAAHVACRMSARDKCVECHMPRIQVHEGFIFSDHWIRVRDGGDLPAYKPAPAVSPRK